ncbi:uncharacterized protein LOC116417732 [Nasonia vitripennis]|uniref:USP domain-containing protein n=1 Tax=Nasonia vitripennis TaxID=7425 RepID=A0A7M7QKP8_NASVI|nr:uncharacterized protein LOC116417732 [Nasonia vitripennis]
MLSVAQAVHHPETPGSASKHSSLGHSWSSDRSSMLKRRKTESECCIVDKKPLTTSSIESITKQFHFNDQEITLTAIPKNHNQMHTKSIGVIQESSNDESSQDDTVNEQISSNGAMSFLSNSGEVQLIKLNCSDNKKIQSNDSVDDAHNNLETPAIESKQIGITLNPIAELSEVTIEPCQKSKKTSSRLAEAREFLKQKETPVHVSFSTSSTNETLDNNSNTTTTPTANQQFVPECNKTEFEELFGGDFDKPIFSDSPKSPSANGNSEHQMPVPTVADYEPFHVGVSCDCFYASNRDRPYYATGFPNPPTENRCWINSTLQVLFSLPIMDDLYSMDSIQDSKLMSSLLNVYSYWGRSSTGSRIFDYTFNTFKEELSRLDNMYPSKAQQDVSEFIMNLLNFIKSEFDSILKKETQHTEIENIPNNEQDTPRRLQQNTVTDSNKRLPLVDISTATTTTTTMQLRSNHQLNSKANSSAMKSKNESQIRSNLIDEYFSLDMVENLVCNGCSKTRQQKVENLMLFVDLPSDDHGATLNLVEMINTTYGTEQRDIKCETCQHDTHSMITKLKRPPKILTIQLKRYEIVHGLLTKKCSLVDIPMLMRLDTLVINCEDYTHTPVYEPICIISHIGDSIDSGHYISFVKHNDQWFYYDDINVRLVNPEEVFKCVQNNAYVIFFQDTELGQNADSSTKKQN